MTSRIKKIKYIYIAFIVFYLISRALPYRAHFSIPSFGDYFEFFYGYRLYMMVDFSFFGLFLLFASITFLHLFNYRKALITGMSGSVIIFFFQIIFLNYQYSSNVYPYPYGITGEWSYGYYLGIIGICAIICINIALIFNCEFRLSFEKELQIRKTILDFSINLPRLKVAEISEVIRVPRSYIIIIAMKMIQNQEIQAKFYQSSRSILFNQLANIEKIDDLIQKYQEWEQDKLGKSKNKRL